MNKKPYRIVIDGAPGAGKTTLLFGKNAEEPDLNYDSVQSKTGFKVFEETGAIAAKNMFKRYGAGIKDKLMDVFSEIKRLEFDRYAKGSKYPVSVYDGGMARYISIAKIHRKLDLSKEYYQAVKEMPYDKVIILEPIKSFDLSQGTDKRNSYRVFSWDERITIHKHLVSLYESLGLEVKVIPGKIDAAKSENEERRMRLELIIEEMC